MTIERLINVLRRATHDKLYRQELAGRIRQKSSNGTLTSWIFVSLKRKFLTFYKFFSWSSAQSFVGNTSKAYIQATRFNQEPHPEFYRPRKRHEPQDRLQTTALRFIAFYLPQFHPFDVNNTAWGEGFTEWTNTSKALPQYKGHYQPHLPADLGYYDLRLPDVMRKQINIAQSYGVNGFCFHYYWFDGKKVMDSPLRLFLESTDMAQSFCICWANENWTRRWDGMESEIILQQKYSSENIFQFIIDIIPILKDPRYIQVDGKPLLIIYRPQLIPELQKAIQIWREQAAQAGLPGIWLVCAQVFGLSDPRPIGFDAAVEFPPHKINDIIDESSPPSLWNPDFKGKTWLYADAVAESLTRSAQPYPLYRCAFPSWDNEARRPSCGHSYQEASPPLFGEWLSTCSSYARETQSASNNFVFINAWNEWAEGAHLEPDRHFGFAWLEKIAQQNEKSRLMEASELTYAAPLSSSTSKSIVAIVIHIYYEEIWPEIASALQSISMDFDLIITTTTEKKYAVSNQVLPFFPQAEIYSFDNRGRDIRPFMAVMPLLLKRKYQAVLKLHSKKTVHRSDGHLWRQKQISQLLPSQPELMTMINSLQKYPSLGLIAPEDTVLNIQQYIGSNNEWLEKIIQALGETPQWLQQAQPWFAAGTMFWFKPQSLQSLLHCPAIQQDSFEDEKGQIDGTLAHAIERAFGCASLSSGYHIIDTRLAKDIVSTNLNIQRQATKAWSKQWGWSGRKRKIDTQFANPTRTRASI